MSNPNFNMENGAHRVDMFFFALLQLIRSVIIIFMCFSQYNEFRGILFRKTKCAIMIDTHRNDSETLVEQRRKFDSQVIVADNMFFQVKEKKMSTHHF